MTWRLSRVGGELDQSVVGPLGPLSAQESRAVRDQVATDAFEDELAGVAAANDRDRWLDISRDWTERLRTMGMEHGRPTRWLVADLRQRVLAAAKSGMRPNDFHPIKDATPVEPRQVGPG